MSVKTEDIEVPATCKVAHKGLILPNGTRLIVVTDPSTKKSAAAASMFVGSHRDPKEAEGLAHLCEHMLFLGTKKYPEEGGFDKFLSGCAGHSNAYTTDHMTCYYFEASTAERKDDFVEALERFSGFFSEPAMTASALEREVQAVHSEDEKNHSVEYWRTQEVIKLHLFAKEHPHSRYGNGNAATLWDGPRANGVDMHKILMNFYSEYYSSENLCFAVYSPLSADEVLEILLPSLGCVREIGHRNQHSFPAERLPDPTTVFAPGVPGSWVNVQSTSEMQRLTILFPLQTTREKHHRFNSAHFLSWLVGHECKGTPADVLREADYITALSTGASEIDDNNMLFQVILSLTAKGLAEMDKVIDMVFDGIDFYKKRVGADKELFEDMLAGSRLQFNLSELRSPASHATSLCRNANEYGVKRAWKGHLGAEELNEEEFMEMFGRLTPERAVFMLHHPAPNEMVLGSLADAGETQRAATLKAEIDKKEKEQDEEEAAAAAAAAGDEKKSSGSALTTTNRLPVKALPAAQALALQTTHHHKARFGIEKIDAATLKHWGRDRAGKWHPSFRRPKTNPFLSSEFGLLVGEGAGGKTWGTSLTPTFINSDKQDTDAQWGRVMWRPDTFFGTPRGAVAVALETPAAYRDPRARFFTRVLAAVLEYAMMELTYFAELAAHDVDMHSDFRGLVLTAASGPRHKMLVVAKAVLAALVEEILGGETVSNEEKYTAVADKVLRDLRSRKVAAPHSQGSEAFAQHIYMKRFEFTDIITFVDDRAPPFAEFLSFARNDFLKRLRYDVLVAGNATEADAVEIGEFVQGLVSKTVQGAVRADPSEFFDACQVLPLPTRKELRDKCGSTSDPFAAAISRRSTNPADGNSSAVAQFYIGPASPRNNALAKIVVNLLRAHYFEGLRTRETLGYIVSMSTAAYDFERFVGLTAQSAKEGAFYILSRTFAFLEAAATYLGPRDAATAAGEEDPLAPKIAKSVAALIAEARDKPKNLNSFVARIWAARNDKRFGFDKLEEEAQLLEQDKEAVSPAAVRRFFAEHFLNCDGARVAAAMVHGSDKSESEVSSSSSASSASESMSARFSRQVPPCSVAVPDVQGKDTLILPSYRAPTKQQQQQEGEKKEEVCVAEGAPVVNMELVTSKDEWRKWRHAQL